MPGREDVCVLIPAYDEAKTIGDVVSSFKEAGFEDVLVVDGHSTDDTREVAEEAGARVVVQSEGGHGQGKGAAVREGVERTSKEYVLLLDGDGTYGAADAETVLEPLFEGRAEHVIGNRFADMRPGAMPRLNRFGNRLFNAAFRAIHGENYVDITSGYRAFTRESFERLYLSAEGFTIETEMAVECAKHDIAVEVVPITYRPRPEGSSTNLNPFRDGAAILFSLYQMAKTHNPLFYFGSVGLVFSLLGVGIGAYVGVEWITRSISHEVLAVVAAAALLFGVQLMMLGVLSDLIVSLHRERLRRFEDD